MASKQTRRSISVRGDTYASLRRYCDASARSMSDVVEEQLAQLLSARPTRTSAPYIARATSGTLGRPAPTPAAKVLGTRRMKKSAKNDYRAISF
jgi:hypothetical protein